MRVTGGQYKNRKLEVPTGNHVRPTSDRMRQSLFNILHHASWTQDFDIENANVLDLFCGSGALGIEALSHGAKRCDFVDQDIRTVTKNASFLDKTLYQSIRQNALNYTPQYTTRYDLVFMDPPYRLNFISPTLTNLTAKNVLENEAIIIIESEKEWTDVIPAVFEVLDQRDQGQSTLHILRYHTAV